MTSTHLPPEPLLIRATQILNLDPALEDTDRADIRIDGGRITAIGAGLDAAGARVIDGSQFTALPGFVDVHRHTWQTAVRHCAVGWDLNTYQRNVQGAVGEAFTAEDAYAGNLLGALSALDAGITTLRDESHAQNSPAHTDALIQALRDSGIRARFAYGWPSTDAMNWLWDSDRTLPDDIYRIRQDVLSDDDALVTLNALLRGPEMSTMEVTRADIARARDLDIAISMHMGTGEYGTRYHGIRALESAGLVGADMTFVHCCTSADDELDVIADRGAHVCVTAAVEASMPGIGAPATGRLLARGIRPSLGVDVEVGTPGDMFNVMRAALASERLVQTLAKPEEVANSTVITAHDLLEFATRRGAAALGLSDEIGSLTPGKQADIILVERNALNLAPGTDAAASLVAAGHAGNVDTVIVAGHLRKHGGRLLYPNIDAVIDRARASRTRLLAGIG